MRILAIIALAAVTFGFASCAKEQPVTTHSHSDGKTVNSGYRK